MRPVIFLFLFTPFSGFAENLPPVEARSVRRPEISYSTVTAPANATWEDLAAAYDELEQPALAPEHLVKFVDPEVVQKLTSLRSDSDETSRKQLAPYTEQVRAMLHGQGLALLKDPDMRAKISEMAKAEVRKVSHRLDIEEASLSKTEAKQMRASLKPLQTPAQVSAAFEQYRDAIRLRMSLEKTLSAKKRR